MNIYTYKCSVERIIDGDTVDLAVDLGFSITVHHRFRLERYDAPETFRPTTLKELSAGKQVAQYLESILTEIKDSLYVKTTKLDIYGRYSGTLYQLKDGILIDINQKVMQYMIENHLLKTDLGITSKSTT